MIAPGTRHPSPLPGSGRETSVGAENMRPDGGNAPRTRDEDLGATGAEGRVGKVVG